MSNSISKEQKRIFAQNLNMLLSQTGKTQTDIVSHFQISPSTVSDWFTAKSFPRVDKIQKLADYFGLKKADLIENKSNHTIDPDMRRIERAMHNMTETERAYMMEILSRTFNKYFIDSYAE